MRMRSRWVCRCGEVYSPTLCPCALRMVASKLATVPLPLVPPTMIERKRVCGSPRRVSKARILGR